jgi:hypothetical protein
MAEESTTIERLVSDWADSTAPLSGLALAEGFRLSFIGHIVFGIF